MDLLKKAEALNQKFAMADPFEKMEAKAMWDQAKKLLLIQTLKENDGLKYLIQNFVTEVNQIDSQLLYMSSRLLPDYERDLLLIEKSLYKKFLDFFEYNDKAIELLEQKIEKEL